MTQAWVKRIMTKLDVNRVDLVDEGADDNAYIKLFKNKGGTSNMELDDVIKGLTPEAAEVVKKAIDAAKSEIPADVQKKLEEMENTPVAKEEPSEEEVLKNADPALKAIVMKAREEARLAQEAAKTFVDMQEEREAVVKAKEFEGTGIPEETIKNVYKSLKGKDSALCTQVFDIMKSLKDTAVASTEDIFDEVVKSKGGADSGSSADAWGAIEAEAIEVAKSRKITKEAAIAHVIQTNPEAYSNYLKTLK